MSELPVLRTSRRASARLRSGYLWIYRNDLEGPEPDAAPGSLVTVLDASLRPLGTALYSSASLIAGRLVSTTADLTREQYIADVRTRISAAVDRRRIVAPLGDSTTAQRLIFSEADALPGIIVDRYGSMVVLQLLTQGTAQDDVREAVVDTLKARLSPNLEPLTIWERPDPRIRELEQLAAPATEALFTNQPTPEATTVFSLNDVRFGYDVGAGQKTGAFLDQRLNYAAAAAHVRVSGLHKRALDICTYHGGFALHLAQVCDKVTGVDQSHSALEAAEQNLKLNQETLAATRVDWIEADAFDLMRALDDAHRNPDAKTKLPLDARESFDAIVLDPPAFAKTRRAAEGALRGYKELNLRALRLLAPGGTLITCSCSHHVSLAEFTEVVAAAAADAGRRVQLLEVRAAAPDHPEVLTLPETQYLKCLILRVE
ncbi:SAM-dependent methyltransferase [Bryocella elongata]|uniref:SAM-dependent methyltransferase n=1 Tax=Bryocella elongata TaxID=863522 RepID=A0A1H5XRF7_9BACT|nr:class I SAM-dependent rRNA methyltransferase [Bryocella elongata]SEG14288.1 SAM-dependent methyltransferase [Bryocella elongata]